MNIIVAVYSDWGIGLGGTQQIVIPEDRRHFLELTDGGVIIAGRKTFEDFPKPRLLSNKPGSPNKGGFPLSNRKNIILTRDKYYEAAGACIAHSIDEAMSEITGYNPENVFVAGGGDIYRLFLPLCDYAYVTKIEAAPPSDTHFPNLDALSDWRLEKPGISSVSGGISYSFNVYKRC